MFSYFQKGEPKINHIKNISFNPIHTQSTKILAIRDKKPNQNVYYTKKPIPMNKGNMEGNRLQNNNANHHNSSEKLIQGKKSAAKGYNNNFKNNSNLLFKRRNYSSYSLGKECNLNSLGYPGPESKNTFLINFDFIRKSKYFSI